MGFMVFSACGNSQQDVDPSNPLIGQWEWTQDSLFTYTFNANGTGIRGYVDLDYTESFDWWTTHNDSRLHINIHNPAEDVLPSEAWDIDWRNNNNSITISSRSALLPDMVFSYNRMR